MFCEKCGTKLCKKARFCSNCGSVVFNISELHSANQNDNNSQFG